MTLPADECRDADTAYAIAATLAVAIGAQLWFAKERRVIEHSDMSGLV